MIQYIYMKGRVNTMKEIYFEIKESKIKTICGKVSLQDILEFAEITERDWYRLTDDERDDIVTDYYYEELKVNFQNQTNKPYTVEEETVYRTLQEVA